MIQEIESWQIDAFVGENSKYYKRKWGDSENFNGGWNWAALFLGISWLAYRKMYRIAVIAFLIPVTINIILIFSPFHATIKSGIWTEAIGLIFAIWGNGIYRKKFINLLEKFKDMKNSEQKKILSQKVVPAI
ncbi:MAG: DUF2628 domain-containing protein [Oscillospiraceae bacterium]|nr:DUF2628 domain-containing protein [Oscillospiraceae bacterium]